MKKLNIVLLLTSAAILAACDAKEMVTPDGPVPVRDKVPLQIVSGIGSTTRAFDSSWDATDSIGVFTTVAGSGTITMSGTYNDENIRYDIASAAETYNESAEEGERNKYKGFAPHSEGSQIYLPADGSNVDVYAYYPWTNGVTASSPLAISIPTSQTLANQKKTDVLMAETLTDLTNNKPINIDHPSVSLLFRHILSKVIIKVKVGTGYGETDLKDRIDVKITGQPINATFQPVGQSFAITTLTEDFTDIIPYEIPKPVGVETPDPDYDSSVLYTYRAILLPNDNTTNPASNTNRKIVFTVGDKETPGAAQITYDYDITTNFVENQQITFTLTLAATGITVEAAITPWTISNINPEDSLLPIDDSSSNND